MRRRCIRCGVPDALHLGLRISPTVNLCDWDTPQRENWPTRRPTCVDLLTAVTDLRGRDLKEVLVFLDAWETAGFPVPEPRYFKKRHMVLMNSRQVPRWYLSDHPTFGHNVVEVTLGSYNNKWWFPVEPHL